MVKPKCTICDKDLLGGYQKIIYTEVDASEVPQEQKVELKNKPEQESYWAHDPKNPHYDIEVFAHKECFDKVKLVAKYKDFDKPTEIDWDNPVYPKILGGIVK